MEDINLHFTGDLHAITAANNLLAAMVDNHIQQGNALGIDPRRVTWRRCMDMNDRQLRDIVDGLGGKSNGMPREDGFDITAASEVMAVFCLASDMDDLKARLERIVVAYTFDGQGRDRSGPARRRAPWRRCSRTRCKPNLVQTLEGTPCAGARRPLCQHRPRLQLRHRHAHGAEAGAITVVTEAGFGADLGAEKFLDIKCRMAGLSPERGGDRGDGARAEAATAACPRRSWRKRIWKRWKRASANLLQARRQHAEGVWPCPWWWRINRFQSDTQAELDLVEEKPARAGRERARCATCWAKGGRGRHGAGRRGAAPVRAALRN